MVGLILSIKKSKGGCGVIFGSAQVIQLRFELLL